MNDRNWSKLDLVQSRHYSQNEQKRKITNRDRGEYYNRYPTRDIVPVRTEGGYRRVNKAEGENPEGEDAGDAGDEVVDTAPPGKTYGESVTEETKLLPKMEQLSIDCAFGAEGRNGAPSCLRQTELFEEYVERAWDLYFGREGQESLQATTPLHLRAQLSSTAYEAVRKLDHSKLRTTTSEGKPTQDGMKLFLKTLKEAIAQEAPVRVNELFLQYFYSPEF
eukprot:symbB.v1.2.007126.t1/scaffold435.1/size205859/1